MLWRDLKIFQIYGANTDVGKTIVSTLLCKALTRRAPGSGLLYLKPVSTGPLDEADDRHISQYAPGVTSRCIRQFSDPVSPHIAARAKSHQGAASYSDDSILSQVRDILTRHARTGARYALLETAGGVLSPGPSGTVQADLYRPLRLPVVLIGDHKLGGIATTISAFESLHVRGYDVDSVLLFEDEKYGNSDYLRGHFTQYGIETFTLPKPPSRVESAEDDKLAMSQYYDDASSLPALNTLTELLHRKHYNKVSKLSSLPLLAESTIWHPFRQHGIPQDIVAIDSAHGDFFQTYNSVSEPASTTQSPNQASSLSPISREEPGPLLTPLFDGSASWWTQGLGHGNPTLALTAAHAAGRYGHVMFAAAVHTPAIDISHTLLSTVANPRLSRVFFSDNGSTAMEVALKMALRASCARYGWEKKDGQVGILGLKGSYHGDTIGVMNCSEPGIYNDKVDWYRPWGFWFDPPNLTLRKGRWELQISEEMQAYLEPDSNGSPIAFEDLDEAFDFQTRSEDGHTKGYENFIKDTLVRLVKEEGRRFGALVMEPILMGAGGMIFVDPLFHRTLIKVIRENPDLFAPETSSQEDTGEDDPTSWSGIPVIADEVFTGLFRLGRGSSMSFLSADPSSGNLDAEIAPDISAHAKLLTGGLLPLSITTASESIFNTFLSDKKHDALLHGHSYTAHAVGCMVGDKSLRELAKLDKEGAWDGYKKEWSGTPTVSSQQAVQQPNDTTSHSLSTAPRIPTIWSFWSRKTIDKISHSDKVDGVFAIGTVFAVSLRPEEGAAGYASNAAADLQKILLTQRSDESDGGAGVHSRVLGNVLYLMASLTTKPEDVRRIEATLCRALY